MTLSEIFIWAIAALGGVWFVGILLWFAWLAITVIHDEDK